MIFKYEKVMDKEDKFPLFKSNDVYTNVYTHL